MSAVTYKDLWEKKYNQFDIPAYKVTVGSDDISAIKYCTIIEITVISSSENEANSAVVHISCEPEENTLAGKLNIGLKVEISLGYSKTLTKVFLGYLHELTALENEYEKKYQLFALDCKGLMALGASAKRDNKKKLSEIISAMIADGRYSSFYSKKTIDEIPPAFDLPVTVTEESDYNFLSVWADILGFYFYIDKDKLYFVSDINSSKADEVELSQDQGIISSEITASLSGQVKKLTLVTVSDETKRIAVSQSRKAERGIAKSKLSSVMGSEKTIFYPSFRVKAQLDALKTVRMKEIQDEYCKVNAVCVGLPELSPLGTLKFKSNTWRITEVIHKFNGNGYKTEICAFAE